jgi:hypothetical protein
MPDPAAIAGILLVAGAVLFLIGAGNPHLYRAWTGPRPVYLQVIREHPIAWWFTNVLFIAGTVLIVAGAGTLPGLATGGGAAWLDATAMAIALAGVLWILSLVYRLAVEPWTARAASDGDTAGPSSAAAPDPLELWSGGLFVAFTLVGGMAMAALGIGIVATGIAAPLVGWVSVAIGLIAVAGLLITGDMPPFVLYLPSLVLGLALLLHWT